MAGAALLLRRRGLGALSPSRSPRHDRSPRPPAVTKCAESEEVYLNGALVGTNGRLPPQPVAELTMTTTVFPIQAGLVKPGATAVVALRAWIRPTSRRPGATGGTPFEINGFRPLATAAHDQKVSLLLTLLPDCALNGMMLVIGIGLLALWRWSGRRELALFGLLLLFSAVYVLLFSIAQNGFLPLSRRLWAPLLAILMSCLFAVQIEFLWHVFALPSRRWKCAATALWVIANTHLFFLNYAHRATGILAVAMVTVIPFGLLFDYFGFAILLWSLLHRPSSRALAACLMLVPISSILTGFGLPPLRIGFASIGFYDLSNVIAGTAITALLVQRALKAWRESNALRTELEAARAVQHRLVPAVLPKIPGYQLEAAYAPAHEVGGDFYQILEQSNGGMLVIVGDVSGKGLQAALSGALALGVVRTLASENLSPGTLLTRMNREIARTQQGGFITCLCARLSAEGCAAIANAGHLPPYRNGVEVEIESGLPLGILPETEYPEHYFRLEASDCLTFLSDGVVEARNDQGELLGFERTRVISCRSAQAIAAAAQQFGQQDDITVLQVRSYSASA